MAAEPLGQCDSCGGMFLDSEMAYVILKGLPTKWPLPPKDYTYFWGSVRFCLDCVRKVGLWPSVLSEMEDPCGS